MRTLKNSILTSIAAILSLLSPIGPTAPSSAYAELPKVTISGELQYLQAENGRVFLAIDSDKKMTTKGDDGNAYSSKLIQLAIESKEMGEKAMGLIGKRVYASGSLMAAHTVHHHTEVLLVTNDIKSIGDGIEENSPETGLQEGEPVLEEDKGNEEIKHSTEW